MDHAVLTRFNLPSSGAESVIRADEKWLRQRVELFERYCLPSVQAQTVTSFGWLVYFDPDSPAWLLERITQWSSATKVLHPFFRSSVSRRELLADIESAIGQGHDLLATTNLDNDDAIATDFVERLQAAPRTPERRALFLAEGLIRRDRRVYARRDPDNAFCTVREPWQEAATCWSEWHNLLSSTMPTQVMEGPPAWLQVIHTSNVSNRVRGRLTSSAPHRHLFPGALDDVPEPSLVSRVTDAVVTAPGRSGADTLRRAAKGVLLRIAGKRGLDRVKLALATARRKKAAHVST
jgi:hypothetical protein